MSTLRKKGVNDLKSRANCARVVALLVMLGVGFWVFLTLWSPYPSRIRGAAYNHSSQKEISSVEHIPPVDFSSPLCRSFLSPHGEDGQLFIQYWALPEIKRDGVFLELGALDGRSFSNSY